MDGMNAKTRLFPEADVLDMASRRENRVLDQLALLDKNPDCCVVSFTMNVAGPVKSAPMLDRAFFTGAARIMDALAAEGMPARLQKLELPNTGAESLFTVPADAERVKRVLVSIEEATPLGRLYDMDVIGRDGRKVGRSTPRKCLICDEAAAVCARSRRHTVAELQRRTANIIKEEIALSAAHLAFKALIEEVSVTPKPGLVDKNNCGANPDMDLPMFERSAEALRPYFYEIALAVLEEDENCCPFAMLPPFAVPGLAKKLREIGVRAEKAMLAATGGVNTHRGAIWSVGLLTAAYAYLAAEGIREGYGSLEDALLSEAAELARALGDGTEASSKGSLARRKYGVAGPVEQAAAGFPAVRLALSAKREFEQLGTYFSADPWPFALLAVMAELTDNNALRRGGEEGAAFVKERAGELLEKGRTLPSAALTDELLAFDRELTERNVSCGGAADMLACAIFIENAAGSELMRSERRIRSLAGKRTE